MAMTTRSSMSVKALDGDGGEFGHDVGSDSIGFMASVRRVGRTIGGCWSLPVPRAIVTPQLGKPRQAVGCVSGAERFVFRSVRSVRPVRPRKTDSGAGTPSRRSHPAWCPGTIPNGCESGHLRGRQTDRRPADGHSRPPCGCSRRPSRFGSSTGGSSDGRREWHRGRALADLHDPCGPTVFAKKVINLVEPMCRRSPLFAPPEHRLRMDAKSSTIRQARSRRSRSSVVTRLFHASCSAPHNDVPDALWQGDRANGQGFVLHLGQLGRHGQTPHLDRILTVRGTVGSIRRPR